MAETTHTKPYGLCALVAAGVVGRSLRLFAHEDGPLKTDDEARAYVNMQAGKGDNDAIETLERLRKYAPVEYDITVSVGHGSMRLSHTAQPSA
jgi:hypothetical protein